MINEQAPAQIDAVVADPSVSQLAALRAWLAADALKIRHRLPFMRVPEVWRSMDGMAHGLDYAARIIDRYAATGRLPVTGGPACDCADPEADHQAMAAAAHERARVERDDELARLRAQVAAARSFAEEMRGYCSWQGISAMYADRLDARLDAAAEAGR